MVLALDVGNTHIVLGVFHNNKLCATARMAIDRKKTEDEYTVLFKALLRECSCPEKQFEGAIISSVVPEITEIIRTAVRRICSKKTLVVGPGVKTKLNIKIEDPAVLGSDLVASAVAAINRYPLPCLIWDLGTCTKISVIDENKAFLGCTISAGINMTLNALTANTSLIAAVALKAPTTAIGRNTDASIAAGTMFGTAHMLEGLTDRIETELGRSAGSIIATGGMSGSILSFCKKGVIHAPNLVLEGLNIIYNLNA